MTLRGLTGIRLLAIVAVAVATALPAFAGPAQAAPPKIGRCPVFSPANQWNQRVDRLPTLRGSGRMIRRIGAGRRLHPDFGSGRWQGGLIGMPFAVAGLGARRTTIRFSDPDYSDHELYPAPTPDLIEDRPDRHAITVDTARCKLYEVYSARRRGGNWHGGSGAVFDLRSDRLRPDSWTSADAAGLPIFPGLVRHEEVAAGAIDHALRIAVPRTRRAWIYPARHASSDSHDPNLPAMGQRLRLKAGVNPGAFPPEARVVVRALQRYGALVADQGPPELHLTGAPSPGWDMDQVFALGRLEASDFEIVDTSSLRRPAP